MTLSTTAPGRDGTARLPGTDVELFARCVSHGDTDAFHELFTRHAPAVRGFIAARVGADAAEDVLVEVFTVAWSSRARFDRRATSARPWLYGIATKLVQRHHAVEARWQQGVAAGGRGDGSVADGVATASRLDPSLAAAIAGLDPREREVLLLVALGELRVSEAAVAIGITPVAARLRLYRARRHVLNALKGDTHA
ncbi:MAG: sigE 11 [Thermoleophilia bacterium]|jgi:RNA polymerase sigma factor (sigma-70 family)|nr:sigE 11 [Thermoleophilia bacterium]